MKRVYVVYISLLLAVPVSPKSGHGQRVDSLRSARCAARCLSELQVHVIRRGQGHKQTSAKPAITLPECLEVTNCSACLKPCNQPFTSTSACGRLCTDTEVSCRRSCQFLRQIHEQKPGQCPAASDATGFEAACLESCTKDNSCDGNLKCCSNGCGHTCQRPLLNQQGLPRIPPAVTVRERQKSTAIELEWRPVILQLQTPILYVIEGRWNIGKVYNPHLMSPWRRVAQTSQALAILRQVMPGRWYQYRIAAVSQNGSRGFSQPTKPLKLSKDPQPPGPPRNLTEGDTRIQNGNVFLTIQWLPPKKSDLPITRYKIFWSPRLKTVVPGLRPLQEERKSVLGSHYSYEIPNLKPGTTYFIQVLALAHYGGAKLRSERVSTHITTYQLRQVTTYSTEQYPTADETKSRQPAPPPVMNLTVSQPYFHNGLLRATVSWQLPPGEIKINKVLLHWTPEACVVDSSFEEDLSQTMSATTHETSFVIYDLRYDCQYNVKVTPVSRQEVVGQAGSVSFKTAACGDVLVRGDVPPDCPTNLPRVPQEPMHLEHNFLISQSNITAVFRWQPAPSDLPITEYRVSWGPGSADPHNTVPVIAKNKVHTKVLTRNSREFSIDQLQEGTLYVVQLNAVSRAGLGSPASLSLQTPIIQVTPLDPPETVESTPQKLGPKETHIPEGQDPKPTYHVLPVDKQPQSGNPSNRAAHHELSHFLVFLFTYSLLSHVIS